MEKEVYIVEEKQWDMYVDLGFNIKSQQHINVNVQKCENGYMITGDKEEVIKAKQFYDSNPIYSKTIVFQNQMCSRLFIDVDKKPNRAVLAYLNTIIQENNQPKYHIAVETERHVSGHQEYSFPKATVFGRKDHTVDKILRLINQHICLHSGTIDFSYMRLFMEKHSRKLKIVDSKENITTFVCTTDVLDEYLAIEITNTQLTVSSLIGDYLSTYGAELLLRLEQEFAVKFHYNTTEKCLDIRGDRNNIQKAKEALRGSLVRKSLPTELNTEDLYSLKDRFNMTAQENSCSFEMKIATQPEYRKLANCRYIATWRHPRSQKKITLIDGHPKDINADSLVILVNDVLFPLHKEKQLWNGSINDIADLFGNNNTKPKVGSVEKWNVNGKLLYTVVIGQVNPKTRQENETCECLRACFTNIMNDSCKWKKKTLLVPVSILDGFISTKDIIRCLIDATQCANEDCFANGLELFVCGSDGVCDVDEVQHTLNDFYKQLGFGFSKQNHACFERVSKDRLSLKMKVVFGSLHEAKADVIVNTTSADLQLSKGTVSKIVLLHAGPEIQAECSTKYPNGIKQNDIAVTSSGNLLKSSKIAHVFHGMLKTYSGAKDIKDVQNLIRGCLIEAELLRLHSIAFPALGTGTLKYPRRDVAKAMFDTVEEFVQVAIAPIKHVKTVKFVLYQLDTKTCDAFRDEEERRTKKYIGKHKLPKCGNPDVSSSIHGALCYSNKTVRLQVLVDQDFRRLPTSCVEVMLVTANCEPGLKLSSMEPCTWLDQYTIHMQADQDIEHALKNAMEHCVKFCMAERVTGIVLKTDFVFRLPEYKQVEYMSNELQSALAANLESCYLHTVYFILPDRIAFDKVEEKLFATIGLKNISWQEPETALKDEMSIELVGSTQASIDRVASKFRTILSNSRPLKQEPRKPDIPCHQYEELGARPKIPRKKNTLSSGIVASYDTDSDTDFDSKHARMERMSDENRFDIDATYNPQPTDIEGSENENSKDTVDDVSDNLKSKIQIDGEVDDGRFLLSEEITHNRQSNEPINHLTKESECTERIVTIDLPDPKTFSDCPYSIQTFSQEQNDIAINASSQDGDIVDSDMYESITRTTTDQGTSDSSDEDDVHNDTFAIVLRCKKRRGGYARSVQTAQSRDEALKWRYIFKNDTRLQGFKTNIGSACHLIDICIDSNVADIECENARSSVVEENVKSCIAEHTSDLRVKAFDIVIDESRKIVEVLDTTRTDFSNRTVAVFLESRVCYLVCPAHVFKKSIDALQKTRDYISAMSAN